MTITDAKYFREHSDAVQVAAYALHDVLHALKNSNCECLVSKEDGHLVVHYCQKHSESTNDKSLVCTDGNLDTEPKIYLHDWNDISNTKIPLNVEIFALLKDRMDPEKLRPAVIVARMMPAKRLTWTKNKEGDVLCYDVPVGNFHSCNGANIKYWKYVNVPPEQTESSCGREQMRLVFAEMFETVIKSAVNESLAKIETACVTALDKFCHQMDSSAYNEQ